MEDGRKSGAGERERETKRKIFSHATEDAARSCDDDLVKFGLNCETNAPGGILVLRWPGGPHELDARVKKCRHPRERRRTYGRLQSQEKRLLSLPTSHSLGPPHSACRGRCLVAHVHFWNEGEIAAMPSIRPSIPPPLSVPSIGGDLHSSNCGFIFWFWPRKRTECGLTRQ